MTNVPTDATPPGFIEVPSVLIDDQSVSISAKNVYMALATFVTDWQIRESYATQTEVAARMRVARRTVARGMAELTAKGYVVKRIPGVYYLPVEF